MRLYVGKERGRLREGDADEVSPPFILEFLTLTKGLFFYYTRLDTRT